MIQAVTTCPSTLLTSYQLLQHQVNIIILLGKSVRHVYMNAERRCMYTVWEIPQKSQNNSKINHNGTRRCWAVQPKHRAGPCQLYKWNEMKMLHVFFVVILLMRISSGSQSTPPCGISYGIYLWTSQGLTQQQEEGRSTLFFHLDSAGDTCWVAGLNIFYRGDRLRLRYSSKVPPSLSLSLRRLSCRIRYH